MTGQVIDNLNQLYTSDPNEDYLRTRSFRMVLTPDEADRLKQQAMAFRRPIAGRWKKGLVRASQL
jgi:hypothetical protein